MSTNAIDKVRELTNEQTRGRKSNDKTLVGYDKSQISEMLVKYEAQITQMLPQNMADLNAQRIIQTASTVLAMKEELHKCDRGTVVAAVLQAAIFGLNPTPQLAECSFLPFWNKDKGITECQFSIGYRGWVTLYFRHPLVRDVHAKVVRQGDRFEFQYGYRRNLVHDPVSDVDKPITHVYAVVRYRTGGGNFVVLTAKEVELIRLRSPMAKKDKSLKGAWLTDPDAMHQAKALKRLRREMPGSPMLNAAWASDDRVLDLDMFSQDGSGLDYAKLPTGNDVADALEEPDNGGAEHATPEDQPSQQSQQQ